MVITNWLARAEGNYGLVFPNEFTNVKTRIYGKVYNHPLFENGEYVQTGYITRYDAGTIITEAGEEFTLQDKEKFYSKYIEARHNGLIVLKEWKVVRGCLVGKRLDGVEISGRVIKQSLKNNICEFEDGSLVFVDWLSKDAAYIPNRGNHEFLLFGIERCMPDIGGKHFCMFRKA